MPVIPKKHILAITICELITFCLLKLENVHRRVLWSSMIVQGWRAANYRVQMFNATICPPFFRANLLVCYESCPPLGHNSDTLAPRSSSLLTGTEAWAWHTHIGTESSSTNIRLSIFLAVFFPDTHTHTVPNAPTHADHRCDDSEVIKTGYEAFRLFSGGKIIAANL